MRQFSKDNDVLVREPVYTEAMFNRSCRYNPIELDFSEDVLPYLMYERLKKYISTIKQHDPIDSQAELSLVASLIQIVSHFIRFNKEQPIDEHSLYEQDELKFIIDNLKESFSTFIDLQQIDILEIDEKIKEDTITILNFFYKVGNSICFKPNYAPVLYETLAEALGIIYSLLFHTPEIVYVQISVQSPQMGQDFKITDYAHYNNSVLVFENIEFKTDTATNLLQNFCFPQHAEYIQGLCFRNCHFSSKNICFYDVYYHLYFQDCLIDEEISFHGNIKKPVEFDTCLINGRVQIKNTDFEEDGKIWIHHCSFETLSSLVFSDLKSSEKGNLIKIEDCIIKGIVSYNTLENFAIQWRYLTFFNPFELKSITLNDHCSFKDLAFMASKNVQMDNARKNLAELMTKAGLETQIEDQGIMPIQEKQEPSKFDYEAYQVAYATGYLKSEFAAYLLEKSVSYLGQKRKKDKETMSRDALPFVGEGKNIQYPVDALLAFKAKDWAKLKELRKKYKNEDK